MLICVHRFPLMAQAFASSFNMQEPQTPSTATAFGTLDMASPDLICKVVDNVPTMIAYFDSALMCRYGNASYRRVFEQPGQALEGASFETLVLPQWRDTIIPRAHAALRGEHQAFEYDRPTPDGGRIHVEVKYTPDIRDGRVIGMFVELHDITSHKRIEDLVLQTNRDLETRIQERNAKLFESEQRFRLMVDGLQDYCIYFLDAHGNITDWTDSAQRMHGLPPHQALRQHFGQLMDAAHPGRNPGTRAQMLRQAIETGQCDSDGWQIRQGHLPFWAHTTLTALRDSWGELQGISVITKDMTDLKRLEDVMNDLNQELEQQVQERTHELTAANRDIDAFAHMVSHDLRAPLRHLSGYLTLLREEIQENLGPDTHIQLRRHVDAMDKTTRRLAHMIEGVLEYARLGRAVINRSPVDLGTLVKQAIEQACAHTDAHPVHWILPVNTWPIVSGEAGLLSKMLECLIDNAMKYTRTTADAQIEVDWALSNAIEDRPLDHTRQCITLRIHDNGVGFDRERADSLFVMFQRQHHSMDFEGSGTGLALSQRIALLHRGSVRIDSQVGQGCTVTILLPT